MSVGRIISILALQNFLSAEGVDEGGTACERNWVNFLDGDEQVSGLWIRTGSAGTTDHHTELDTLLDILLATDLELGLVTVDQVWREVGENISIQGEHGEWRGHGKS
jgi:hypothetical protein